MGSASQKAIAAVIADLNKRFGDRSVQQLGNARPEPVESIPTGSLSLDQAIGCGGYPRGRIIEIYGPESSGKTTLALHAIANAQRDGGVAAIVDAEHALDIGYAEALGVDVKHLLVSQPDNGEQALEIADTLIGSGTIDVIVIDSVAALTPRAEIEGDMGVQLPGAQARLMSQALRKMTATAHRTNTLVIFINQIRMKIGVMYGSPETTTGGNALKFYASIRLDVRKIGKVKEAGGGDTAELVGNETRVKVVKNKMAPPFREAEFAILYGKGIDTVGDVLTTAIAAGVVEQKGSHFSFGGDKLGQGFYRVVKALSEDLGKLSAITAAVLEQAKKAKEAKA